MVTPELALEWAPPNDPRLPAMLGVLRDDAQQVGDLAVSILDVLFRHWDDIDADSDDHDSIHAAKDADLSWAGFGVLFVSLECMLRFSIEAVVERFAVSRVATKRIVHYVGGRGLPPADAVRSGIRLRDHFVTHIYHLVCALANSAPGAALLLTHHILSAALLAPTATPVALLLRLSQHSCFFAAFAALPDAALIAFLSLPSTVSTFLPVLYALIREGSQCQRLLDHQVLPLLLEEAEIRGTPEALDAVLHLAVVVDDPSEVQLVARAPQLVKHVVNAESGNRSSARTSIHRTMSNEWRSCLRYKLIHFLHIAGRVFSPTELITWVEDDNVQRCIQEVLIGHNREEHTWITDFLAACALKRPLHGSPKLDSLLLALDTLQATTLVPGRALILFWLAHTRQWATTLAAPPHALAPAHHPSPTAAHPEALLAHLLEFTAFDALRMALAIPMYRRLIFLVADTFVHLSTVNAVQWPPETLPALLSIVSLGGARAQQWVEGNISRLPAECDSMLLPWLAGPYSTTAARRLAQRGLALDDANVGAVANALPVQERGAFLAQRLLTGSSGILPEHTQLMRDNLQWVFPHAEGDSALALEEFIIAGAETILLNDDQLFALLTVAWEKKRWGRVLRYQAERPSVRPPPYVADIMAFLLLQFDDTEVVTTTLLPRYESSVPFWVLSHPVSPYTGGPFGRLLIRHVQRIPALWPYIELCVSLTGVPTELFDDQGHALQFMRACVTAAQDDAIPHAMGALLAAFARPSLDHWLMVEGRIQDEFLRVLEHVAQHELHAEHAARARRLLAMATMVEEDSYAASVAATDNGADIDTTERTGCNNERIAQLRHEDRYHSSTEGVATGPPAAVFAPPSRIAYQMDHPDSAAASPEKEEHVQQSHPPTPAILPSAFLCHRIAHKTQLPQEDAQWSPRRANVGDIMASLLAQPLTVSHPVPGPREKVERTAATAGDRMEGAVTSAAAAHHKQEGGGAEDDLLPALMHGLLSAASAGGGVSALSAPLCTAVEKAGAMGDAAPHGDNGDTTKQGIPTGGVHVCVQNTRTMTDDAARNMGNNVQDAAIMTNGMTTNTGSGVQDAGTMAYDMAPNMGSGVRNEDGVDEMGRNGIDNVEEEDVDVEALQAELERLERELAKLEQEKP